VNRVLVIRLSHLGDVILTEPVIRSIKSAHPGAEIDYLTRSEYADAVRLMDGDLRVLPVDVAGDDRTLRGLARTARRFCPEPYDLMLDLHYNLRSWWMRRQVRANRIITYPKNYRSRRKAVKRKIHTVGLHSVDLYLAALRQAGIQPESRIPRLAVTGSVGDETDYLSLFGIPEGNFAVFAVGASHPPKHYPLPQWVKLAELVINRMDCNIVILERENWDYLNLFDGIPCSGRLSKRIGLRLNELARVISKAAFAVSNDSGIMHLAAAVGIPTVGLFGPTHPSLGFSPLGDSCRAITVDEECSPCSRHGERECYRSERFCFTRMTPELIIRQIEELIQ
jgi:heptosyltransferase-2